MIKASAFTSDSISNLSDFQFRLWVGLITHADNLGRGDARPAILKGSLFSLRNKVRESDIEKGLQALANNGSILLYRVAGKPFYEFPNWAAHQRLRKSVSKFPSPEDADSPAATRRNSPQAAANGDGAPQNAAQKGSRSRREVEVEEEDERLVCDARAREDDHWDEFWMAYPQKTGDIRTAAMEYIRAIADGASPDILIAAAKELDENTAPERRRYIPSAEKWLRNKGWLQKQKGKQTDNVFLQIYQEEYGE